MFGAVSLIYDTTVDTSRWGAALDEICATVGGSACALLVRSTSDLPYEVNALSRAYRDYIQTPDGLHYLRELRAYEASDWEAFARQPVGSPFLDAAVGITNECLDRRPDCIALEQHLGVRRRLGVRLNDTPVWFDGLTMSFPAEREDVPISSIIPFVPHLARAVELGRTFSHLQERYKAVLTVLDRVSAGLAIALADGQIIVANAEAERLLSSRDGISLDRGKRLLAASQSDTMLIQKGIALAAETARGEGSRTETRLQLTRRDHTHPLLVDITPLSDSGRELDLFLQGALVTLIDPDRPRKLEVVSFANLHGFTAAEQEVCKLLVEGNSVKEIAEIRNTTHVTAKNQINRILGKVGAGSRFDLIRRIVRTLPQFL